MSSSPLTDHLQQLVRPKPRSLSQRLVILVAVLIAVVGALVSAATAAAMNAYLNGQLDSGLVQSFSRLASNQLALRGCPTEPGTPNALPRGVIGQGAGVVGVWPGCAFVVSADHLDVLSDAGLNRLQTLPADARPHSIEIPGLGHYRVVVANGVALGYPLHDVDEAVTNLVLWELALTLAGVIFAVLMASELIRRTLRPLRKVAATALEVTNQPLAKGEPSIAIRVPEEFTDHATEVGQMGAALNTLLTHVDDALTARHNSELRARQFVADASHELRTPLATIQGYAELSRRTPDDAAALMAALDKLETEAHRMSALVDDLLLLARLDSGRPLDHEEVDLTRLLLEAVADARVLAPEHHWKLSLPSDPISVWGDAARLHQVVTNLLSNARQHTPAGTAVTVSASEAGHVATVTIHDDGPGLPEDLVGSAFERFTRGDSSRTRTSGGAGLGLSLVAAITGALGGTVVVDSVPGSTTFTITLPAKEDS